MTEDIERGDAKIGTRSRLDAMRREARALVAHWFERVAELESELQFARISLGRAETDVKYWVAELERELHPVRGETALSLLDVPVVIDHSVEANTVELRDVGTGETLATIRNVDPSSGYLDLDPYIDDFARQLIAGSTPVTRVCVPQGSVRSKWTNALGAPIWDDVTPGAHVDVTSQVLGKARLMGWAGAETVSPGMCPIHSIEVVGLPNGTTGCPMARCDHVITE